jgi:hypothetical protein
MLVWLARTAPKTPQETQRGRKIAA